MTKRSGFTLVELVVVILILGILAGVAAPKMLKTSATATDNGLRQTLSIVRDAIELYAAENAGAFPTLDAGGGTAFRASLAKYIRGPFPKCPVGPSGAQNHNVIVDDGTGSTTPTNGWMYDAVTGAFMCANSSPSATDGAVTYYAF